MEGEEKTDEKGEKWKKTGENGGWSKGDGAAGLIPTPTATTLDADWSATTHPGDGRRVEGRRRRMRRCHFAVEAARSQLVARRRAGQTCRTLPPLLLFFTLLFPTIPHSGELD